MPSCSIGFCVPITRKGMGRGRVIASAVTCRSSIASKKCRLGLGRGPVDLITEDQVGEYRTRLERGAPVARQHGGTGDVGRDEIGSELNSGELQPGSFGQGSGYGGFGHTGNVLKQDVAIGQQCGDDELQHLSLADDGTLQLVQQPVGRHLYVDVMHDQQILSFGAINSEFCRLNHSSRTEVEFRLQLGHHPVDLGVGGGER